MNVKTTVFIYVHFCVFYEHNLYRFGILNTALWICRFMGNRRTSWYSQSISSFSSNDLYSSSEKIRWSRTLIPNRSPALTNLRVTLRSSELGLRIPLGWLWAMITAVALSLKGVAKTSVTSTSTIRLNIICKWKKN